LKWLGVELTGSAKVKATASHPSGPGTPRALIATSLDVFWLKDRSLTDLDNLPEPDELAEEIIENLEAGLSSFRQVLAGVSKAR
jgi:hypothetical protein